MTPHWDDPAWQVRSDNAWQRGLRSLQGRWREDVLGLPAGPNRPTGGRDVVSTLAIDAPVDANFLTAAAAEAAAERLAVADGAGFVSEDRLRRNLLSSQPMCFNAFGHVQHASRRHLLLPWVRLIDANAAGIERVELEWAPPRDEHFGGGSAFDAFVEYRTTTGGLGFLGVECKYHEDLTKSDPPKVRGIYGDWMARRAGWVPGAVERLDAPGTRQFLINALLAESLAATDRYESGTNVVVACAADRSARAAYRKVRAERTDLDLIRWAPWESLVEAVDGEDEWRGAFVDRYLDFTPIGHLLADDDPRRAPATVDLATAHAVAIRVLGDGSVLDQLQQSGRHDDHPIWRDLAVAAEELKELRQRAGGLVEP